MNPIKQTLIAASALTLIASSASLAADIPASPRDIQFDELVFEPPSPSQFRHELSSGIPVFMAESHEFPLVTITFSFKGGEYMEPADLAGLGAITGQMMRQGGTTSVDPKEFDERVDFLAANIFAGIGTTSSSAGINCLTSNLDEAFDLFLDMLQNPGFDADRLNTLRGQALEGIKTRNDNGIQIAIRELGYVMWGDDHFESREATKASLEAITPEAMSAFHQRIFHPGNLMIAVSGDFQPAEMLSFLENKLAGWPAGEAAPEIPVPAHAYEPGVYYYEKDQNQVQVLIAHRGVTRDDPDSISIEVMNDILGGSGFTSRITNRVRTEEGLAYTAGSTFQDRVEYPGVFLSYFFTKTPTTALATRLVFDEIDKIQKVEVTTDELETIQSLSPR
jgi:zinc protease